MVLRPLPQLLALRVCSWQGEVSQELGPDPWHRDAMLIVWSCVQDLLLGILPDHHSGPPEATLSDR